MNGGGRWKNRNLKIDGIGFGKEVNSRPKLVARKRTYSQKWSASHFSLKTERAGFFFDVFVFFASKFVYMKGPPSKS